ncbi:hypothetical protein [Pedobacter sp. MR2016-24]|uniref:hypothetical protein n=1 Tax=Pedobacter sp. MR2016-24 TaxID=2994466 RepID=UPI002248030F|nr:hypothetical protein [Pedobacter sp. MR2016-24]MCX2484669.1 hypothetical protein [Pedobacter sp. MR2016-24]
MLSLAKKADWRLLFGDETLKQSYSFWFLMNRDRQVKERDLLNLQIPFHSTHKI